MLSFIDGLLLRFRPFNAIAQIKRINRPRRRIPWNQLSWNDDLVGGFLV